MNRPAGFTLIELIVTIVLLSLLAAAVAPLLLNTLARGEGTLTGETALVRAEATMEHLRAQGAPSGDCDDLEDPCEEALDCGEAPAIQVAWEQWEDDPRFCHVSVDRVGAGGALLESLVDPSNSRFITGAPENGGPGNGGPGNGGPPPWAGGPGGPGNGAGPPPWAGAPGGPGNSGGQGNQ